MKSRNGRHDPVDTGRTARPRSQRDREQQRHAAPRTSGQRQRVHALLPQPLQPEEGEAGRGQQRDLPVAERPRRRTPAMRDDAEPADQRDRAVVRRLGDQVLDEGHEVVDDQPDLVEEVQEERVGVAVGADRVVDVVQPAVQRGQVGRRRAPACACRAARRSSTSQTTRIAATTDRRPAHAGVRAARPSGLSGSGVSTATAITRRLPARRRRRGSPRRRRCRAACRSRRP